VTAPTVVWFRRDLRLADHPALVEAARRGPVLPLFVVDPALWEPAGANRRRFLVGCLASLSDSMDGALVVRTGDPVDVVPQVVREVEAGGVVVSADFGPYGHERDERVEAALGEAGARFERIGSPYAVDPGTVLNQAGDGYKVFTPFYRAWKEVGFPDPVHRPRSIEWISEIHSDAAPDAPRSDADLPTPGEAAAKRRLDAFLRSGVADYGEQRNRPGVDGTSRLSPYLKWGCIHPRQILSRLGRSAGEESFRSELAWREFYADVLLRDPGSAFRNLQPRMDALPVDTDRRARERFAAWQEGRTGFPIVDAGMRQIRAIGWMHNRVRMIVASFLVKDLHLPWERGARHFHHHLVDGDIASNQLNWQWVAGTGRDAAPYFRVFNPVTQGKKFDPDGAYVRRWVPELRDVPRSAIHEPWTLGLEAPEDYPPPLVDHARERRVALEDHARRPTA
jgi:deoxyribodipyrimidine photo-lyase